MKKVNLDLKDRKEQNDRGCQKKEKDVSEKRAVQLHANPGNIQRVGRKDLRVN